jgi:hypothetical protein
MKAWREHGATTDRDTARPTERDPGKGPSTRAIQRKAAAGGDEAHVEAAPAEGGAARQEEPVLVAHATPVQRAKGDGKNAHRGRIQVQGGGLENSRSWTQDAPRTKADGLADLVSLKGELSKTALKKRTQAFADAADFIQKTNYTGPPKLSRSFRDPEVVNEKGDERVDIEIITGTAFQ